MLRSLLTITFLFLAAGATAQTYTGSLDSGDETLESGEYRDAYTIDVTAGEEVSAVVTSSDFDSYVILVSPSGEQEDNDDCTEGDTSRSCATLVADVSGTVRVLVTSYAPGETGAYTLVLSTGGGPVSMPTTGDMSEGTLGDGDETLASGEYVDRHDLQLAAGERVRVELLSADLDPYLIVKAPDGTLLGQVGDGSRKDVRDAVEAAWAAFPGWGKRSAHDRSQICFYIAENLAVPVTPYPNWPVYNNFRSGDPQPVSGGDAPDENMSAASNTPVSARAIQWEFSDSGDGNIPNAKKGEGNVRYAEHTAKAQAKAKAKGKSRGKRTSKTTKDNRPAAKANRPGTCWAYPSHRRRSGCPGL